MKPRVLAILQARISSTRLPGKVLMPIIGQPMLLRQIERLKRCVEIDRLLVATSTDPSDDPLAILCRDHGIECVRGSLRNVLERFVEAARPVNPDIVVRLTGDCPLADPALIDAVIRRFLERNDDYLSNCTPPTYPDGLDVEVMRFSCLEEAHREAVLPSHREHVTLFIRRQPERYRLGNYADVVDRSHMRWTVDEVRDFEFVRNVYEALYPDKPDFTTEDILGLLERAPQLLSINSQFKRGEGGKKSLLADAAYLAGNQS